MDSAIGPAESGDLPPVLSLLRACGLPVYLLSQTAEGYFRRRGFVPVAREEVPEPVRGSVEFRFACPASAVCLRATSDWTAG